jgi:hypothetical protein
MKKGLLFFLGIITGAILTVGVLYFVYVSQTADSPGTKEDVNTILFSEPGEVISFSSFKVMQVLPNGSALAESVHNAQYSIYGDPLVLFTANEGSAYYDDQIIKVPAKKVARQVGTFRYTSGAGFEKTVPIVKFFDK